MLMQVLYCMANQLFIHLISFTESALLLAYLLQKMVCLQYDNYITAQRIFSRLQQVSIS